MSAAVSERDQALMDAVAVCDRIANERRDWHAFREQALGAGSCAAAISALIGTPPEAQPGTRADGSCRSCPFDSRS